MKQGRWILLCLLGVCLSGWTAPVVRLAGDVWPPYTDSRLPGDGLAISLVRTALERAGYRVDYEEMPWPRAVLSLERGQIDGLSDWHGGQRSHMALHSTPYLYNHLRWIARVEDPIKASDLTGKRVALVRGYVYTAVPEALASMDRVYVNSFASALRMLEAGRVDLALEDSRTARFHMAHDPALSAEAFRLLPGSFSRNGLSLVIRESHPQAAQIIADFEREIAEMRADGTFDRLIEHYDAALPEERLVAEPAS